MSADPLTRANELAGEPHIDELTRLRAEVESLKGQLEISRSQTKDAFERVANEHNENVSLRQQLAEHPDKKRLDWLESRKTEVHFWNKNGNGKCSFIENWDAEEAVDALREASSLREAIDRAMEKVK